MRRLPIDLRFETVGRVRYGGARGSPTHGAGHHSLLRTPIRVATPSAASWYHPLPAIAPSPSAEVLMSQACAISSRPYTARDAWTPTSLLETVGRCATMWPEGSSPYRPTAASTAHTVQVPPTGIYDASARAITVHQHASLRNVIVTVHIRGALDSHIPTVWTFALKTWLRPGSTPPSRVSPDDAAGTGTASGG